jgi:ribose transport system substrate-binding protein
VKKNVLVFCLALLMMSFAAHLTAGAGEAADNIGDNRSYGVSVMTMNNPFFVHEVDGVKEAVKDDKNTEVLAPDPANDIMAQISQISEFIAKKVDVIIVDPIDSDGIKPSLVEAQRAGIPVINIDSVVADTDLILAMIVSDNMDAGVQSARVLCNAIGGKGEIAIVNWSALGAVRARTDGLKKVIKEEFPEVTIIADQDAYGKVEDAQNITDTFMQAYPNLKGIFAINDPTAQGVVAAIQGANRTGQIPVVSVDGSQNAIEMIRDGQLLCSPMQQPVEIGKMAVTLAKKYWAGESVTKDNIIPVVNITTENFKEYDHKTY